MEEEKGVSKSSHKKQLLQRSLPTVDTLISSYAPRINFVATFRAVCLCCSEAPRLCSIVRFQPGAFYDIHTHIIYSETDYPNPVINPPTLYHPCHSTHRVSPRHSSSTTPPPLHHPRQSPQPTLVVGGPR